MAITHRTRLVNPRLGAYFSIVASGFVALFLVLFILEQLGSSEVLMRLAVLVCPLLVWAVIGLGSHTVAPADYFAAGRRVPAVYNGLVIAVFAVGGTGYVAATGLFLLNGFDAWCFVIGSITGLVIMGMLIVPFLRKYGGYTVPSFLSRRFSSPSLQVVSAVAFIVPMLLLLIAEIKMATYAMQALTDLDVVVISAVIAFSLAASALLGGQRGIGWTGTAQAIAALLAVVTLAAMLGVIETNLPLAQFSYGPVLRGIGRMEVAQGVGSGEATLFGFQLAGLGLAPLKGPMATPYESIGSISFALMTLTVAAGIAGAPWLLQRSGTTVGVYEARKSLAWTIFFVGVAMLTLSALAVFMRDIIMREVVGQSTQMLPRWFADLVAQGQAAVVTDSPRIAFHDISFHRDSVLFAIPNAAGFSDVVQYLVLAGAIAAALAASAATSFGMAATMSEDIISKRRNIPATSNSRLLIARLLTGIVILCGTVLASFVKTDPFKLLMWAISISAAAAFPVIVLAIWWQKMNTAAALASVVSGLGFSVLAIVANEIGLIPLSLPFLGVVGILPALTAAAIASHLSSPAVRSQRELIRDVRIPGGETIYDREQRLIRLKEQ